MPTIDLEQMAAALRGLPVKAEATSADVAKALYDFARDHAGNGLNPDGTPWAPSKDGRKPLANAMASVRTAHNKHGASIIVGGPTAIHDLDRARGDAEHRQVIPHELTEAVAEYIGRAVKARLDSA